ncbi:DUF5123 domain-containing protein [Candidatus Neomarinimicrobiota bacterium]
MKTNGKVRLTAFMLLMAGVSLAFGQTVIQVEAGIDVLKPAIDGAAAGDIIELITDGGAYLDSNKITIDKDLTIRGLATLPNKPIVKYIGTSSGDYMYKAVGSPRIVLENLEFDGDGTDEGSGGISKYVFRLDNVDVAGTMSLFVENVIAHDFADKFFKPYGNCGMDSLVITNSIFYNGAREAVVFYSGSSSDPPVVLKYGEVSNSTFYSMGREMIKSQTTTGAEIVIDRNTFYDAGAAPENKPMIYIRNLTDVVVKNSIFVLNNNEDLNEEFADFTDESNLFHNNVFWGMNNFDVDGATSSDTLRMDPGFADAANADFSLTPGSPLLVFADDGGAVGDPRWAPTEGPYAINIFISGEGTVAKDPDAATYAAETVVTLTATPATDWKVDHWSSNINTFPEDNPVVTITVTKDEAVSVYFVPALDEFDVEIVSVGLGHVDVEQITDFNVDGYFAGDSLVLTAVADADWEFAYWTNTAGDSVDNTNPAEWNVDSDSTFTAQFRPTLMQYAFDLTVTGNGTVDVDPMPVPGFTTYDVGTVVTLIADAVIGWSFDGYTVDATGTNDTITVTLDADKAVTATFSENTHANGVLDVDDTWDLLDAVEYAHNNSQVDTLKLTSAGPYTPTEAQRGASDGRMPYIEINSPVAIVGDPALGSAPVLKGYTSTTGSTSSEGFFRFRAGSGKLYLKNLIVDGFLDEGTDAYPAKYLFRADDGGDTVFCSIDVDGVEFMNTVEAFWKSYALAYIDTMRFVNTTISNIGKEMIFLNTVGQANYVELSNSTFHHIGRQMIYLKAMSPTIVVDHVTIDSSGHGYGTEGPKFAAFRIENCEDVTIKNTIVANMPWAEDQTSPYVIRISGASSNIDNVLFHNTPEKVDLRDDANSGNDLFWYDAGFAYATPNDFTLKDSSIAYHMADDESVAIGDLRWATSSAIAVYHGVDLTMVGEGDVSADPMPMGKFFIPGTVVALTADPDTLWAFGAWSGDLTSTEATTNLTMDSDKTITVTFEEAWFEVTLNVNMSYWADQAKFTVGTDIVDVAGTFTDWGGIPAVMDDTDGDTIYTATFKIDELIPAIEWKFRINSSWDDATCEFPSGGPNRTLTVTADTDLTFWYNDEEPTVGIDGEYLPISYALNQNYPNPFNPSTTIQFALVMGGKTSLVVYDVVGREVVRLVDGDMPAGFHSIVLNQPQMASGIYFYRLISGEFTKTHKMLMLK